MLRDQIDVSLLQKLKFVRSNVKEEGLRGQVVHQAICSRLTDLGAEYEEIALLYELFGKWPKFSGDKTFPVPSTDPELTGLQMYISASHTKGLWTGEYGALRMELLEWLINDLEGGQ